MHREETKASGFTERFKKSFSSIFSSVGRGRRQPERAIPISPEPEVRKPPTRSTEDLEYRLLEKLVGVIGIVVEERDKLVARAGGIEDVKDILNKHVRWDSWGFRTIYRFENTEEAFDRVAEKIKRGDIRNKADVEKEMKRLEEFFSDQSSGEAGKKKSGSLE